MSIRLRELAVVAAVLALAACGGERGFPTAPGSASAAVSSSDQDSSGGGGGGGTVKETLVGSAINGVTPSGEAIADQSRFSSGGSTILTVQVKNVNLRDGTVLGVTLDFTPIGTLTLSGRQGTMTANLGHFGVSRDQVRVKNGDTVILQGGFFQ